MIYTRKAHYHETDQMGIIHHSNYIKWFEEARVYLMDQIGVSYKALEAEGIICPVLSIACEYKDMVTFDETVAIHVETLNYTGVKLEMGYTIKDTSGVKTYTKGVSKHCFLNQNKRVISLKKVAPKIHEIFMQDYLSQDKNS